MSNLLVESQSDSMDTLFALATGSINAATGIAAKQTEKSNYSYSSIINAGSQLVTVFPVLCSRTVSPETAQMVSKHIEQISCQFIMLALQQANIDTAQSGIDYIRKYHQNLDIGGNGVDTVIATMSNWIDAYNAGKITEGSNIAIGMYNKTGIQDLNLDAMLESDTDVEISSRDMTRLMEIMKENENIQFFDTQLNPISINDFSVNEFADGSYRVSIKPYILTEKATAQNRKKKKRARQQQAQSQQSSSNSSSNKATNQNRSIADRVIDLCNSNGYNPSNVSLNKDKHAKGLSLYWMEYMDYLIKNGMDEDDAYRAAMKGQSAYPHEGQTFSYPGGLRDKYHKKFDEYKNQGYPDEQAYYMALADQKDADASDTDFRYPGGLNAKYKSRMDTYVKNGHSKSEAYYMALADQRDEDEVKNREISDEEYRFRQKERARMAHERIEAKKRQEKEDEYIAKKRGWEQDEHDYAMSARRDEEYARTHSGRNVSVLKDQEIKKMNDAMPSILVVKFYHRDPSGRVSTIPTEFIVGVKSKLIPVTTTEVLRRIMNDNKDGKKFITFMRAITGELRASELILGLSRIKDDVKSCRVKGAYGDTWNLLANRAKAASDQVHRGQRNDFSAITTLVISQYDAEELFREENFDISDPKNAYHFMQSYNLMAFAIVDDSTESMKILYDNNSKSFDEIAYRMLERDTQDGTYKKLINLMAASK